MGQIYSFVGAKICLRNTTVISKRFEIEASIEAQSNRRFKALLYSFQQILLVKSFANENSTSVSNFEKSESLYTKLGF